jgi:hexosaminidase
VLVRNLKCSAFVLVGLGLAMAARASPGSLIPAPQDLHTDAGGFAMDGQVQVPGDMGAARMARVLLAPFRVSAGRGERAIELSLVPKKPGRSDEAYRLSITPRRISIEASGEAGLYYGVQTLLQMIPDQCAKDCTIPAASIDDWPRFRWRGLLIDVARHFFDVAALERIIDSMAQYKLNVLHLHLTDDTGWRIEIPAYPKLVDVGARGDIDAPGEGPPRYYRTRDIQELVNYAAQRQVTIVPEIELPGHGGAAARSYPEFYDGGGTINPGKPESLDFVRAVYTEVARLFPSRYLHFGGDEVDGARWNALPEVTALKQRLGFSTTQQVEAHFDAEVAGIIRSLGRIPMAWDETVSAGADPSVTVQWWRKARPDVRDEAVHRGQDIVLSPVDQVYFDYPQGLGEPGAPWEGNDNGPTSLRKVLQWQSIPAGYSDADIQHVLGVEAAVWTEFIRSEKYLQFMLYPRLQAFAELAWNAQAGRDPADFERRLKPHLDRMVARGVRVRRGPEDAVEFQTH